MKIEKCLLTCVYYIVLSYLISLPHFCFKFLISFPKMSESEYVTTYTGKGIQHWFPFVFSYLLSTLSPSLFSVWKQMQGWKITGFLSFYFSFIFPFSSLCLFFLSYFPFSSSLLISLPCFWIFDFFPSLGGRNARIYSPGEKQTKGKKPRKNGCFLTFEGGWWELVFFFISEPNLTFRRVLWILSNHSSAPTPTLPPRKM